MCSRPVDTNRLMVGVKLAGCKYKSYLLDFRTIHIQTVTNTHIVSYKCIYFFPSGITAPSGPGPPHYRGFTITLRHTTLGRTPLDEWPARRIGLYMTTHNTHKRQTSMRLAGFESTIPAREHLQTHALDCTSTGIGIASINYTKF
jgi:hypothetical protein